MASNRHYVFEAVVHSASPMRLDKYLATLSSQPVTSASGNAATLPSRSALKARGALLYAGGKRVKFSQIVHDLDTLRVEWSEEDNTDITAEDIPLDVLYEDDNVTVVNKAQGMVCHPAAGHWHGTLVNALLYRAHIASTPSSEGIRSGIVHRLDKDTSGVIITAKNEAALAWLQRQFASRAVRKEYIAICKGRPQFAAGIIDCRIARDKHDRKKFAVTDDPSRGKAAKTIYHCIACYGPYSVLRLRLKTGRTHQLRVHLKHIACPILGDALYSKRDGLFPDAALMLHSRLLEIRLPASKERTLFIAPLPERICKVLNVLKRTYPKEHPPMSSSIRAPRLHSSIRDCHKSTHNTHNETAHIGIK